MWVTFSFGSKYPAGLTCDSTDLGHICIDFPGEFTGDSIQTWVQTAVKRSRRFSFNLVAFHLKLSGNIGARMYEIVYVTIYSFFLK